MRAALVLLTLLAPTALATNVLVIDGFDSGLVPCVETATVRPQGFSWAPRCVEVLSGEIVTWHGNALPHAVGTRPFLNSGPGCVRTGAFEEGGSAMVRFFHDSTGKLRATTFAAGAWGPARDCSADVDPVQSADGKAVLPYHCIYHSEMRGHVVVRVVPGSFG